MLPIVLDYKFLGVLRSSFPAVPIMGLTAAANSHVIDDIQKVLTLKRCLVFKAPFDRPNLYYEVAIFTYFNKAKLNTQS